jgi:glycerate 2-kinase
VSTKRDPVVVLAPDSFKGSLGASDLCVALEQGVRRVWPQATIRARPMADGGEGTLDAVLAAVGAAATRRTQRVRGAAGRGLDAAFGVIDRDGARTAVIEVAQIVGITDDAGMAVDVEERTTTGVGELIRALLDEGVERFMIGLGGSSTNDGGAGMLNALGLDLVAQDDRPVAPTPRGLANLARVDASKLDARLSRASMTIMSDVSNPLTGPRGATAVFGPQKGVQPDSVSTIDAALARFAHLAEHALARRVSAEPGAGAAGGLGFALQLLGARFASGAEVVAELIALDHALQGADWAITGEGRSDAQTLSGKAPFVVAAHGKRVHVPVSLLSGAIDAGALEAFAMHFAGCFALPAGPMTLEACIADASRLVADRAEQMARLFGAASG